MSTSLFAAQRTTPAAGWRASALVLVAALCLAACARPAGSIAADGGAGRPAAALPTPEARIAAARAVEQRVNSGLLEGDRALGEARYADAELAYESVLAAQSGNERALAGLRLVAGARRHEALFQEAAAAWGRADSELARARLRSILAANPRHKRALEMQRLIEEKLAARGNASTLSAAYRKPITIEFQDTPLKTVFEVLSRASGLNFVFDKDLRADQRTTIYLRDSSIEAAINVVLLTNQLEQRVLDGNSLLIYPNTPAKQKEYQALTVKTYYLANADAKTVAATLKTIVRTKDIVIDEKLNLLVVRDSPEAIRIADKLVALQDVPEPEVLLEVEILEVKRSRLRDLGVKWPDALALSPLPRSSSSALTLYDLKNLDSRGTGASIGSLTINARDVDSDVNLLANPRIRARNREKAKILIGERVPNITSTITATGFSSESIAYIDVGLKLDVEPTIYLDNEVAMKISLEVSNILSTVETKSGTVAYQIGTRSATSVLRLKDGENQLLAGLINDEDRRTARKVPYVGDLPVLGRLFGSQNDDGLKTEIVLSITPRILRNIQRADAHLAEFDGGTDTNLRASLWPSAPAQPGANRAASPQATVGALSYSASSAVAPMLAGAAPASALVAAGAAPAGASAQLGWQGASEVRVGESVSVQLTMQADRPIVSLPLSVSFDPRRVQVTEVSEGGFMRQGGAPTNFTYRIDPGGQVIISATRSGEGGASAHDVVATLTLRALSPGSAQLDLISVDPVAVGGAAISALLPAHDFSVVP